MTVTYSPITKMIFIGHSRKSFISFNPIFKTFSIYSHFHSSVFHIFSIQIHEFEALLFSNPIALAKGIYRDDLAAEFEAVRNAFPSPEDINDHPNTAPSKRIINLYKKYNKSTEGILAAIEIGLTTMRKECKHFDQWLKQLESLNS